MVGPDPSLPALHFGSRSTHFPNRNFCSGSGEFEGGERIERPPIRWKRNGSDVRRDDSSWCPRVTNGVSLFLVTVTFHFGKALLLNEEW